MVKKWIRAETTPRPRAAISLPFLGKVTSIVRRIMGLPPNAKEWSRRAYAAFYSSEFDTVIECATLAIARDRYLADGYYIRAMAFVCQEDWTKSIEDWNFVVRLLPKWATGWNERGRANLKLGRVEEAIADFNRAVSRDDRNAVMLANRGYAHAIAGNHIQAEKDFESALAIDAKCIVVYQSKANYLHSAGRIDEAIAECNQLIKVAPVDAAGYLLRGSIYFAISQHQSAISDLTRAIELGTCEPIAWEARGHSFYSLGKYHQAVADTNKCLEFNAKNGVALNNRGLFLSKLGDFSLAVSDLREAIEILPLLPNSYKNLAWIQATCPEAALRDGRQAVANAVQAWEMSKGAQVTWLEIIAAAHAETGDFEAAIAAQRKYLLAAKEEDKEAAAKRLALYERGEPFRDFVASGAQ